MAHWAPGSLATPVMKDHGGHPVKQPRLSLWNSVEKQQMEIK